METINGSTTQRSTRAFYSTLRPRAGADILKHSAYGALYGVAESLLAGSAMVRRLTARQTAVEAMRGESSHAGGVRGSHGSIHDSIRARWAVDCIPNMMDLNMIDPILK